MIRIREDPDILEGLKFSKVDEPWRRVK